MPAVLRFRRFRVIILLPPREHPPAHVHVEHSDGEVIVELEPLVVRQVNGAVKDKDVATAYRLVEANVDFLLTEWRKYHG